MCEFLFNFKHNAENCCKILLYDLVYFNTAKFSCPVSLKLINEFPFLNLFELVMFNFPANILTTPPEKTPSANNVVRKYLRSIEHSRPISKAIEESRDSYGKSMSSGSDQGAEPEIGLPVKPRGVKRRKNTEEVEAPQASSTEPEK
jgi:hypothetical protein